MRLYTAGYRDARDDRRLPPEVFYGSLPPEAVVADIRSHPYSPFAPDYTASGVAVAVERWKPGCKRCVGLRDLGNTNRGADGVRRSPPIYVDAGRGFAMLEALLRGTEAVVIFCACSQGTFGSPTHRCHRFFVAEEMARRLPGLDVVHLALALPPHIAKP